VAVSAVVVSAAGVVEVSAAWAGAVAAGAAGTAGMVGAAGTAGTAGATTGGRSRAVGGITGAAGIKYLQFK